MNRLLSAAIVAVFLGGAIPCAAAPSPWPKASSKPSGVQRVPGFSTRVKVPSTVSSRVSAAACNRRTVAVNPPGNQLGPNGASQSQTLVAVPIGGNSVAGATRDHEITEACAHQRN